MDQQQYASLTEVTGRRKVDILESYFRYEESDYEST